MGINRCFEVTNEGIKEARFKEILSYIREFTTTANILLLGGAVKYILGLEDSFRDIDVIVKDDFDIESIPFPLKRNMYGGCKFEVNGIEVDLWKLKDHIVPCKTFEDVEETWLLSTDALYLNLYNGNLYSKYYREYPQINFGREIKEVEKEYLNQKLRRFKQYESNDYRP